MTDLSQGSAQAAAPTDELKAILEFLYGADELDGISFGKFMDGWHPTGEGRYWWRSKLRAAIARALAAPAPTQQPKHVHEAWWLVEATFAPVPLYFAGPRKNGKGPAMVAEVNGAVRFPDKDSAERTMCLVLDIPVGMGAVLAHRGYAAREHIFDYTPRAALSGAAPIPQPELTDEQIDMLAFQFARAYTVLATMVPFGNVLRPFSRELARAVESEVRSLLAASPAQEAKQSSVHQAAPGGSVHRDSKTGDAVSCSSGHDGTGRTSVESADSSAAAPGAGGEG